MIVSSVTLRTVAGVPVEARVRVVPALGDRGHCAQEQQCPTGGCACKRQLERELRDQQKATAE